MHFLYVHPKVGFLRQLPILRVLKGELGVKLFNDQQKRAIQKLNVQIDYVHLLVRIPPKDSTKSAEQVS